MSNRYRFCDFDIVLTSFRRQTNLISHRDCRWNARWTSHYKCNEIFIMTFSSRVIIFFVAFRYTYRCSQNVTIFFIDVPGDTHGGNAFQPFEVTFDINLSKPCNEDRQRHQTWKFSVKANCLGHCYWRISMYTCPSEEWYIESRSSLENSSIMYRRRFYSSTENRHAKSYW